MPESPEVEALARHLPAAEARRTASIWSASTDLVS